jgi:hypothetical protein
VNLTVEINAQPIIENVLIEKSFNQVFNISCKAYVDAEMIYLSGGNVTFINGEFEIDLNENADYWFNASIPISTSIFSIGPNYAYIKFQQNNYTTTTFSFQIFVNQLEIEVETPDFEGVIEGKPGKTILIRLNLTEEGSNNNIQNATIFYSWNFSSGYFNYIGNGIYELELKLPIGFGGTYNFDLFISHEEIIYKSGEFTLLIEVSRAEGLNLLTLIIIYGLIALVSVLGILSLRSYVIIPRKRKKEAELMDKIQVFKDVQNTQAVTLIQRYSGLPLYSDEFSIVNGESESFLISGFIQAITAFSEALIERELKAFKTTSEDADYSTNIIELDFKYFQLLVCDNENIRILLILRERASERLKKQVDLLSVALESQYAKDFRNFSGNADHIKEGLKILLNQFLFLHYNDEFEITKNKNYLDSIMESKELSKMETRLLNVILSMTRTNRFFRLRSPIDLIHEKKEDLVLEAIYSLILRKLIISTSSTTINLKK